MKHFTLFKAWLMLCLFLIVGGGNSWADTSSWTHNGTAEDKPESIGNFTVAWAKGSGSTAPTSYTESIRLYAAKNGTGNTITISNKNNYYITKVEFTGTVNQGTLSFTWNGTTSATGNYYAEFAESAKVTSVTATLKNTNTKNTGQFRLTGIKITYTPSGTPVEKPTNLSAGTPTSTGTTLSWDAVEHATAYKVEYKVSTAGSWTTVNPNPTTASCELTGLTPSTTYAWQVTALSTETGYTNGSAQAGDNFTTAAPASHKAYFYVNGTLQNEGGTSFAEGASITFPADPADIEGKKFMGWTQTQNYSNATDAPSDMTKSATMGGDDVNYYAVFAKQDGEGEDEWVEIFTAPTAGTYAICSDSYFMKAEISSSRFANGDSTPQISEGKLTTAPAEDCIWEISKPDTYYRIKNGTNYAGGTNSKNQGALLDDSSKDLTKWEISYIESTSSNRFEIINYGRSQMKSDYDNKYLRNNGSNGWATYAQTTGSAPRLFKKEAGTTYSDYCTSIVKKFDVTFNLQGHGEAVAPQAIAEGETVAEPTAPEATGYTFGGWYKEAECTNAWNFSTDVMGTSAIILYAKWTVNSYTITYNNVEGATHSNPATYTIETATINLADASKDGFIFQGWFDNEGLTGDAVTTIAQGSTGDKTFWAKWAEVPANPSVVTFNVGKHGTCATESATEETVGAGVVLPAVTAHEGWVFKGWSTSNPATAETIVSAGDDGKYHVVANTTLYAYYKVKPATPTFSSEAGAIEKDTEVTISCTTEGAAIYYTTNGDEPTAESAAFSEAIAVNAEQTIKAIAILDGEQSEVASAAYTIAQHTAQFSINGVITDANNCTVAKGEAITFPADPAAPEEHVFIGWKKGGEEVTTPQNEAITTVNKDAEVMGTEDVIYYAVWAVGSGNGEESWNKVTSADAIVDGGQYILAGTDGENGYYAAQAFVSGNKNIKTASATINDNIIAITDEENSAATLTLGEVTIEGNTYYTINDGTNYWYANGATLTKPANQLMGHSSIGDDGRDYWTITLTDGVLSIVNKVDGRGTMQYNYNNGSPIFNAYSSASQKAVELYKYNAGSSYTDFCTKVVVREISNIAVKTAPTSVDYCEGETFNPAGLEITVNYTEGDPEVVAYAGNEAKFTFSPALDAELVATNDQVTITYKNNTCQQAISVRAVSINAPVAEGGSYTVKVGDAEAVTADGNTIAAKKGQKIVLASTANPGYRVQSTPFVVKDEDDTNVSVSTAGGQYSFTMPGKNVTITAQFTPVYTITAGSCEHGSITAIKDKDGEALTETSKGSKVVVEATAETHYHLTSMYYVKAGEETQNAISETEGVYSFTMPQSNVTVYATFAEDEKVTITWSINGNTDRTSEVYVGEAIEFPTDVEDVEGKVFRGWVGETDRDYANATDAPTYANVGTVNASTAATYYAVFATAIPGEDEEKTSTLTLNDGSVTSPYSNQDVTWNFSGLTFCSSSQQTSGMPNDASVSFTLPENAKAETFTITSTSNSWSTSNISLSLKYGETQITSFNNAGKYDFTESNNDKGAYSLTASNKSSKVAYIKTLSIKYLIPGVSYSHYCTTIPTLTVETEDGVTTVTGNVTAGDVTAVTAEVSEGSSIIMTDATVTDEVLEKISDAVADKNILIYAPSSSESTATNVVVSGTCENLLLTDKVAVNIPEEITATNIKYDRGSNLASGSYATIYLPYAFNVEDYGFKVMKFDRVDGDVVSFEEVTGTTEPNVPYIIRPNGSESVSLSLNITGGENTVTTTVAEAAEGMSVNDKETDKMLTRRKVAQGDEGATGFYGTYEELTLNGKNGYYGFASGVFKKANTSAGTKITPFRAYLFVQGTPSTRLATFSFEEKDNLVTRVNNVIEALENNEPMYDLNGHAIAEPVRGQINIIRGQKVIFK